MRSWATAIIRALSIASVFLAAPVLAKDTKVLLIPIHGKAGSAFDGSVTRLLEKPLTRHATVISGAQAKQAQRKAHIRPTGLHNTKNVRKLGKAGGANYVLIIEATGRKPHLAANTTLVDVQTGKTVLSDRYDLTGVKLTPEVAAQILAPIVEKLGGGDDSAADSETANNDEGDETSKPVAKKAGKKYDWPANKSGDDAGQDPTEQATASTDDAEDDDGDATNSDDSSGVRANGEKPPKWRPALRLIAGITALQRDARISSASMPSNVTPPCYCGTKNNANPFFPAGHIGAELYPFAFGGKGAAIEGLGLTLDLTVTQVKSFVQPAANSANTKAQIIGSTLFEMRVGPTYRWVLWDSLTAPDIDFNAGFAMFMFPLSAGGFPGLAYTAPYVGISTHVPLGIPELQLVAGAAVMPGLQGGSAATALLSDTGKQTGGIGFNADGGLRFAWDRFELMGLVRYQQYNLNYSGNTKFEQTAGASSVTQLSNVTLTDKYLELMLTGGVVF